MKTKAKENDFNLFKYIKPNLVLIILYIISLILGLLCNFFIIILSADALALFTENLLYEALSLFFYILLLGIAEELFDLLSGKIYNVLLKRISYNIRCDITDRTFSINSKAFGENSAGVFVLRICESADSVISRLSTIVICIASLLSSSLVILYIMFLNPAIGGYLLLVIAIVAVIERIRITQFRKNNTKRKMVKDKVASHVNELIRSEKDIKSLNLEDTLKETSNELYDEYRNIQYKANMNSWVLSAFKNIILAIFIFGLIWLSIYITGHWGLAISSFMFIVMNYGRLYMLVYDTGNILESFTDMKIEVKRIKELFDETIFPVEKFGKVNNINLDKFGIEFKNVSFSYGKTAQLSNPHILEKENQDVKQNKNKVVLKNINLEIKSGETVAIVGKSGSGKSTILSLIPKLYECDNGEVLLGGVNVKKLSKECLRKNVALVNQFPYIFNCSIRENLLFANKNATEKDLWQALKDASLDEFVKTLDKKMDTVVGENGIKLSGGEKQRLAIARVFLKRDCPIILFDESTSSLDNFSQEAVKQSVEKLQENKTVVIVAHRLSTIKNVDKIFYLENGQIVDSGTFNELYKKNKTFKKLFEIENI